jgi:hypothetical protein
MKFFFKAVVALVLGIGYILAVQATPMPSEIGHVELMQGEVIVHPLSGLSRQVGNGTQIYEGETIETTDGAVVISLIDGSILEFYDYSKFTFQEYRNNGVKAKYELHQGAVTYTSGQQVTKTDGRDIKFKAGTSLVSPIGTGFILTRENLAGVSIAIVFVNYGSVNLHSHNKSALVNPGEWGIGAVRTVKGQKNGQISIGKDKDTVIDDFIKDIAESDDKRAQLKEMILQLISKLFKIPDSSKGKHHDNGEVDIVPGGGEEPASPNRIP